MYIHISDLVSYKTLGNCPREGVLFLKTQGAGSEGKENFWYRRKKCIYLLVKMAFLDFLADKISTMQGRDNSSDREGGGPIRID